MPAGSSIPPSSTLSLAVIADRETVARSTRRTRLRPTSGCSSRRAPPIKRHRRSIEGRETRRPPGARAGLTPSLFGAQYCATGWRGESAALGRPAIGSVRAPHYPSSGSHQFARSCQTARHGLQAAGFDKERVVGHSAATAARTGQRRHVAITLALRTSAGLSPRLTSAPFRSRRRDTVWSCRAQVSALTAYAQRVRGGFLTGRMQPR